MTTAIETLADRISACISSLDYGSLTKLYRPDTVFEGNVPYWRYQLRGPEATCRMVDEELAPMRRPQVTESRRTLTVDGVVVETEVHHEQDGEQRLWRDVHVIHTDGERITEHVYYCTGSWDAATIRRQADEAPMVRRGG
jgi:ketosteroid isomerase-like protein